MQQDQNSPTLADPTLAALAKMTDKEIGLWVHSLYPEEPDPGINRARCDVLMEELGRELPDDWMSLMTDGKLSDRDFPAWGDPDLSAALTANVKVFQFGV